MKRPYPFLVMVLLPLIALTALMLVLRWDIGTVRAAPGVLYVHPTCNGIPDPCYTSIQAAVDAASPGDEVRIATGVYTGVQQRNGITQVVYIAKNLSLLGGWSEDFSLRKPSAFPTVIDAQGRGRAVVVYGPVNVTLDGLEITGGDPQGLGGIMMGYVEVDIGGGLYVFTATVVLSECLIHDNVASQGPGVGGGIGADGGQLLIQDSEIYSNSAVMGGGIYAQHNTLILTDTFISHNVTTQTEGHVGSGGGIAVSEGVLTATRLVLAENESYVAGGGLYLDHSGAVLSTTEVYSNVARQGEGGGIYAYISALEAYECDVHHNVVEETSRSGGGLYLYPGSGDCTVIEHCEIHNNRAGGGGGIEILGGWCFKFRWNRVYENLATTWGCGGVSDRGGSVWFRDGNLILKNRAATYGGGLCIWSSTDYWRNTVVAGNVLSRSDGHGAGIYLSPYGAPDGIEVRLFHMTLASNTGGIGEGLAATGNVRVWLTNTIVVSHAVGPAIWADTGSTVTLEATLWHGNGAETGGPGTMITTTPDLHGDPRFVAPDDGDYRLLPGSAAIDAGVDAGIHRDLEMDPRPSGGGYDIGADEYLCHAVEEAKILGPEEGLVGTYTFTARAGPLEALPPFTYTWQPEPDAGQGTSEATYSWDSPGTYAITVTVENCGGYVRASHVITLYAPAYGISLTPASRSAEAAPGDTVVYTHTLRNTGNVADTYTVTLTSTQGWAKLASSGTVNLNPQATAVITVEVTVPPTASAGTDEVAVVKATSWASPAVYARAVDTTTVTSTAEEHRLYLPLVLKARLFSSHLTLQPGLIYSYRLGTECLVSYP